MKEIKRPISPIMECVVRFLVGAQLGQTLFRIIRVEIRLCYHRYLLNITPQIGYHYVMLEQIPSQDQIILQ